MRIRVCDLRKSSPVLVAVALIITLSISIGSVINYYGKDLFIQASTDAPEEKIVIIDAGHGGEDCGAIGVNGVYEKDLNLEIAMSLGDMLQEKGFAVVYTRTEDKMLYKEEENIKGIRKLSDLKNRCAIAERYPEALFVSVHMNSFGSSKYSGLQVYYSDNEETSYGLAESIQRNVRENIQPKNNRVVKTGENIYVLENINNPAVLIECGFLSNSDECKKLSEKEYQKQLSFSIVCGIIEYVEKISASA